jgi:hypothetical protein
MTRIVRTAYRYKRPPQRKAVALATNSERDRKRIAKADQAREPSPQ